MSWLVTGGAGYIGSHVVRLLAAAGRTPVIVDDLSSGSAESVPPGVVLERGTLLDAAFLDRVFDAHPVDGVVHLAGYKYAGLSVGAPLHAYRQNVAATLELLGAMQSHGVQRMVFSSSAAVYGTPSENPVAESAPTRPESPYGESKLIGELLLADQGVAVGLRHTSLRYFNVIGAGLGPSGGVQSEHAESSRRRAAAASADLAALGDRSPHSLLASVFAAITRGERPVINGNDYPTDDGTCVRDFVHVSDLARSHVAAVERLSEGAALERVYNLGSGAGTSVGEIMRVTAEVTGLPVEPTVSTRRPGDPAAVVASGSLAARDLDWAMRHSVTEMVGSAWQAYSAASVRGD